MSSGISYEVNVPLLPKEVAALFESSGINRPFGDVNRIATMFSAPSLQVSAWDRGTLVGVARSLTDFAYSCYLCDLAVARGHQGQGIGKELLRRTRQATGDQVTLVLISAPEAAAFYERLGLQAATTAFLLRRQG